jgi:hypothetical protein
MDSSATHDRCRVHTLIATIDRNGGLPHSRAEVKYECQLPAEYEECQSTLHRPAISPALAQREEFLLGFAPTGDLEDDMTAFLIGTGQEDVLAVSHQRDLPLRELAASIRYNHQDEIANLKQGKRPLWSRKYQRWTVGQKLYYANVVELECKVLDSILERDGGMRPRSAA